MSNTTHYIHIFAAKTFIKLAKVFTVIELQPENEETFLIILRIDFHVLNLVRLFSSNESQHGQGTLDERRPSTRFYKLHPTIVAT